MVVIGIWVAVLGYTVMYAGVQKLSGDSGCSIGAAIQGKCGRAAARALTMAQSSSVAAATSPPASGFNAVATGTALA